MNPLYQGIQFILTTVNTFWNFPFPGLGIGVGYVFFAAISIPMLIAWLYKLLKGW